MELRARPRAPLRRLHELGSRWPPGLRPPRPRAPGARPRAGRRRAGPCVRGGRPRLRGADRPSRASGRDEEPTAVVLSDHGMKPIYWTFHAQPLARGERPSALPPPLVAAAQAGAASTGSPRGRPAPRPDAPGDTARIFDRVPLLSAPRAPSATFADIDFGSTRAYAYASGGQIYPRRGKRLPAVTRTMRTRLAEELAAVRHPETGEPAFDVKRKEELFHGPFLEKAPELDPAPVRRADLTSTPRGGRGRRPSSGTNASTLPCPTATRATTASPGSSPRPGPGSPSAWSRPGPRSPRSAPRSAACSASSSTASTVPRLVEILEDNGEARRVAAAATRADEEPTYSAEEEAVILERLRDLGYE